MLKMDGHDNAILGVVDLDDGEQRLVYSWDIIIQNLKDQGMDYHEAVEFYDFNIGCAYISGGKPLVLHEWNEEDY
jgi:hypothetical protein